MPYGPETWTGKFSPPARISPPGPLDKQAAFVRCPASFLSHRPESFIIPSPLRLLPGRHAGCIVRYVTDFNILERAIMDYYAEKKRPATVLSKGKHQEDLCAFGIAAPHCALSNSSRTPIRECEEYQTTMCPEEEGGAGSDPGGTGIDIDLPSERAEHPPWERIGLCGDCAAYDTCPFPKYEGGVWRCEEYR
ncbi:MAG: hypothetical protein A4E57_04510 [Syntrophorhabdaceae bacterium PtaU1.Bin034]|nr:MAG: hypothetical protein A4E57_04510 [Syntrophorhabdaceae bacterium PtaU1.Bin034]